MTHCAALWHRTCGAAALLVQARRLVLVARGEQEAAALSVQRVADPDVALQPFCGDAHAKSRSRCIHVELIALELLAYYSGPWFAFNGPQGGV